MSEPSCLPPPGTASGTTHVLRGPGGDVALVWREEPERTWWASHVIFKYALDAGLDGYRYLGPLTLPAEVERLRAEVTRLRKALETLASLQHERDACAPSMADYARAALEPPHD